MVKPVVSAGNAWTCIVLSVFAIVILSTIGALFKSKNHSMMGGEEDPEDGDAVAGAVFGAVFIYIVCATGKTAPEMLRILESRMENGTEEELAVAAAEQSKITKLRLKKLVQE